MKFGAKLLFKKGLDVASRAITFKIGKKLIVEVKKHTPELYSKKKKKKKKKKSKKKTDANNIFG